MKVGIVGTGAWGRALATLAAEAGHRPRIGYRRRSPGGFPGTPNLEALARESDLLVLAVPPAAVPEVLDRARPGPGSRVVVASRGIEPATGRWLSEVVVERTACRRVGALGGPALAAEVFARRPSALVAASRFDEVARLAQRAFHSAVCRVYTSDDLLGVELAGAAVDVLAAIVGIADALDLGAAVRGVIVTRGLAEYARLGAALGARPATLSGLAGVGDLVGCGCHPDHPSYAAGHRLARGGPAEDRVCLAARAMAALGRRHGVELPLTEALVSIASGEMRARLAFDRLMRREAKAEGE